MTAAVTSGVWAPGARRLTTGLVLTVTLVAFESLSVATVLPVVNRDLGDVALYGWVFSGFFLASLIGIVAAGDLADRQGLAPPLLGGLVLFAAGLAIAGAATNMPVLVGGRVVQGLGAGAVPAVAYAAIGRAYAGPSRPRMFAVLSTAWVLPGLLGPAAAALVATAFGWRWVFFGMLPLVGLAAGLTLPAVAQVIAPRAEEDAGRLSLVMAGLVALGAGLILLGLNDRDWPRATGLVVVGTGVALASLRRLTPAGTLRFRSPSGAAVAIRGVLTFAFFAADVYVPLSLISVRHTSTTYGGLTLTASTLAWTGASWVQARTIGRSGPRRLVRLGFVLVAAGVAGMLWLVLGDVPVVLGPVSWAVAGFGMGLAYSSLSLTVLDGADTGGEGRASAGVQLTDVLGTALGTGIAGAAIAVGYRLHWQHQAGLALGFALALAVGVLGVALASRLPRALRSIQ